MTDDQAEPVFDVGRTAQDGTLGLWLAREAVRNAELLLAAQSAHFQSLDARMAQVLAWSVTGAIAVVGAALNSAYQGAAGVVAVCLFAAAVCCAVGLWPMEVGVTGRHPRKYLKSKLQTEWAVLYGDADGYSILIEENNKALNNRGFLLRAAFCCFLSAPMLGGLCVIATALAQPGNG